jgi:hypothetical protein
MKVAAFGYKVVALPSVSNQDCQNCKIAKFPLIGNLGVRPIPHRVLASPLGTRPSWPQTGAAKMVAYPEKAPPFGSYILTCGSTRRDPLALKNDLLGSLM